MATRPRSRRAKGAAAGGAGGATTAGRNAAASRKGARSRLHELFPDVSDAYEAMARAARDAGPLDARAVALVKVALSVGRGSWRGTHAHVRKALEAGATPAELRQLVAVAVPTVGLAAALDALRWIDETIEERSQA